MRNTAQGLVFRSGAIVSGRAIQLFAGHGGYSFKLMQCKHLWHCWQIAVGSGTDATCPRKIPRAEARRRFLLTKSTSLFTAIISAQKSILSQNRRICLVYLSVLSGFADKIRFFPELQKKSPATLRGL